MAKKPIVYTHYLNGIQFDSYEAIKSYAARNGLQWVSSIPIFEGKIWKYKHIFK